MTSGSKIDDSLRDKLFELYCASGNASKAARQLNIPVRTACEHVRKALEPGGILAEARKGIRTHALDACQRAILLSIEKAGERVQDDAWITKNKLGGDPGPAYITSLANILKALALAEQQDGGPEAEPLEVNVYLADGTKIANAVHQVAPEAEEQAGVEVKTVSCDGCEHWEPARAGGWCTLTGNASPPNDGCARWLERVKANG